MTLLPAQRLLRKRRQSQLAVTSRSVALFRLGEVCNNHCPMCSNSGRPAAFYTETDELLRRVDFLHQQGVRRVVVTGGEPTIHRGFFKVVARLRELGIIWDINTHGRSFADADFTEKALDHGLERAIVSFHSHQVEPSCIISGFLERHHHETIAGIRNLVDNDVWTMLNTVLTRHNVDHLEALFAFCLDEFKSGYSMKFAFPSTTGKGGAWPAIELRYGEVAETVGRLRSLGAAKDVEVLFESFPNCIVGDPQARNMSRSGFGESHYLDDLSGDRLYPIRYIESELSAYGPGCKSCPALTHCCGVSENYARQHGVEELVPFQ